MFTFCVSMLLCVYVRMYFSADSLNIVANTFYELYLESY